ncbi:hypothetical protein [Novosphingobium sp. HII-3]|uniref:hypothetical protein n=1 Tax=Novosphingobium sp. HII-3 TaxID=2075565 RepID=UPI000CDAD3DC|nr:hypothetical protein [Novosphingobium sp. HII-3]
MTRTVVTLEDKYTQAEGQVLLSALQGVVRLLLDQARQDRAAGRARTASPGRRCAPSRRGSLMFGMRDLRKRRAGNARSG